MSSSNRSTRPSVPRKSIPEKSGRRGGSIDEFDVAPIRTGAKILVVDDDQAFLELLLISADRLNTGIDLRLLKTNREKNHVSQTLRDFVLQNWIPDLVVVDINIAEGGHSGEVYVNAIREDPGFSTIPLVLTTSSEARWNIEDVPRSRPEPRDLNWIQPFPIEEAPDKFHDLDIQAVLYAKAGTKEFLLTLQRLLDSWKTSARRQTWTRVIQHSIEKLNSGTLSLKQFGDWLLEYSASSIGADHAFLRMVNENTGELAILSKVHGDWVEKVRSAAAGIIPILDATSKSAQYKAALDAEDAGAILAPDLVGMSFLGTPLYHAGELVGVLTLTRDKSKPCFRPWELGHLENLGQQLAAVFGRENKIRSDALLQKDLLDFGTKLQLYPDSDSLCEALARQVHAKLHRRTPDTVMSSTQRSKTTVRLIDRGTDDITRRGSIGDDITTGPHLKLNDISIIAQVCRSGVPNRIPDVTKEPSYTMSASWVRSELCVPIKVGDHPLGALNLEHESPSHYVEMDMEVAESYATLAAHILSHQRQQRFVNESILWITAAHKLSIEELWSRLQTVLFQFCDYGCLLHLEINSAVDLDGANPWRVMRCHRPRQAPSGSTEVILGWQRKIDAHWEETLLYRIAKLGRMNEVFYSEIKEEFLTAEDMLGAEQMADAYVPLIQPDSGQLIGALFLLWFQPPTFGEETLKKMLAQFGGYCAELVTHQIAWEARQNRFGLDEQQRIVGAATLWSAHTYTQLLMNLDAMQEKLRTHLAQVLPLDQMSLNYLTKINKDLAELQREMNSTVSFVREPTLITVDLAICIDQTLALFQTTEQTAVQITKELAVMQARADVHILVQLLRIVVQNALYFVSQRRGDQPPRICIEADRKDNFVFLRISDSGPGVCEEAQRHLFLKRYSSKSTSGVGLLLAKERAVAMGGDLRLLAATDGARLGGATFEIQLRAG